MQYGLKRESIERLIKGMKRVSAEMNFLKGEASNPQRTVSEEYINGRIEDLEMTLTILSHIQESLEDFDFVILDKKEYDYVSGYMMENL